MLQALKAEIESDPAGVGYAAFIIQPAVIEMRDESDPDPRLHTVITLGHPVGYDWPALANALNQPRGETLVVSSVPTVLLRGLVDDADLVALSAENRAVVDFYLRGETVDVSPGSRARTALGRVFPQGSATRTNWLAALNRMDGSRAERVFGPGVSVTVRQSIAAVRLP